MAITLEDIGYNQVLTKDYPLADLDLVNDTYQDDLLGVSSKAKSSWWDAITPEMLGSGFLSSNVSLIDGYLMSANYIENQSGWKVDAEGDLYANSAHLRGELVAGEIHTPSKTAVNSFHTNKDGDSWWGCTEENFNANKENAIAYVLRDGTIKGSKGKVANWNINENSLSSAENIDNSNIILDSYNSLIRVGNITANHIIIDGGNQLIRSSNYTSGTSGFLISPDLIEAQNLYARGKLSSVVFETNIQQALGGQLVVSLSDKLAEDMTSDDNATLTIDGSINFAVNDILRIKDNDNVEYLRVSNISNAPTYTVIRDLAGSFLENQNPEWKKGTAIVVIGNSNGTDVYSGGWLELLGSGLNSPYYSVIKRTGVEYNDFSQVARFGNLKGFLDYYQDEYGIAIGDSNKYFTYDPSQGIRLRSTKGDYIIEISTDPLKIRLNDGSYDRIVIGETDENVYGIEIRSPSGVSMFDIDNNNQRISTADGKTYWDLGAGRFIVNDGITDRILIGKLD